MGRIKEDGTISLNALGLSYGFRYTTNAGAVQDIMKNIPAVKVKRLLKALIDQKIVLPKKLIVVRLATSWLIQREFKHQETKGESLLPYPEKLYNRAVNYGKKNAKLYS